MDEEKKKSLSNLKADILGLVMSNPSVMNLDSLVRDFRTTIGCAIPVHKYGYSNIITFIRNECSDILRPHGDPYNPILTPIVTSELKHVNDMIYKQKSSGNNRNPRRGMGILKETWQSPPTSKPSSSHSGNINYQQNGLFNQRPIAKNIPSLFESRKNYPEKENRQFYNAASPKSFNNSSYNIQSTNSKSTTNNGTCSSNTPKPAVANPKPSTTQETGQRGEFAEFPKNHRITKKLIEDLKELMEAYPGGLWCRELSSAFKMKYMKDLEYTKLGFHTAVSICRDLPMVFKITRPGSNSDWRLFVPNAEVPPQYRDGADDNKQPENQEEKSKPKPSIDEIIFGSLALPGVKCDASLYPEDCATYGEALPGLLPLKNIFLLQISQVRDPYHFWFQVISKSTSTALDYLMDEMTDFYVNDPTANNYCMVRAAAKTGQLCAVPYEGGRHHRAIVLKNVSWDIVKVFYVDYGTIADVQFSQLRMLLNKFCDFAIQAHRGRLAGVLPILNDWSKKAKDRFMELITDLHFQGQIVSPGNEEDGVTLTLTNHYEEIDVAAVLISEGLAKPDNGNVSKTKYYKSFQDLEDGIDDDHNQVVNEELNENNFEKNTPKEQTNDTNSHIPEIDKTKDNTLNNSTERCENTNQVADIVQTMPPSLYQETIFGMPYPGPNSYMPAGQPYPRTQNPYGHPMLMPNYVNNFMLQPAGVNYFNSSLPPVYWPQVTYGPPMPSPNFPLFSGPINPMPVNLQPRFVQSRIRLKRTADPNVAERAKLCESKNTLSFNKEEKVVNKTTLNENPPKEICTSSDSNERHVTESNADDSDADSLEMLSSDSDDLDEIYQDTTYTDEYLTMIAFTETFDVEIEIWSVKSKSYIMLQQCSKAFLNVDQNDSLEKKFEWASKEDYLNCVLLQDDHNVVKNMLCKIKETGCSGVKEGEVVKLKNKKIIDFSALYILLIPIEKIFDVMSFDADSVRHTDFDLMKCSYELYAKFVPLSSDSDSSDYEDN